MFAELALPGFVIIFFGLDCLGAAVGSGCHRSMLLPLSVVSLVILNNEIVKFWIEHKNNDKE